MASNFFQQQDAARRRTFRLVVYFVLAILILIALVYALLVALSLYDAREPVSWWQWRRRLAPPIAHADAIVRSRPRATSTVPSRPQRTSASCLLLAVGSEHREPLVAPLDSTSRILSMET